MIAYCANKITPHPIEHLSYKLNGCNHSRGAFPRQSDFLIFNFQFFFFLRFWWLSGDITKKNSSRRSCWKDTHCIFSVHNKSYSKCHPTQTPPAARATSAGSVNPSHTLTHLPRCQKYPLVRQIWGESIIYSILNDICSLPVPGYLRKQPSLFLMNLYICNLLSKIHAGMNGLWGWQPQRRVERGSRQREMGWKKTVKYEMQKNGVKKWRHLL